MQYTDNFSDVEMNVSGIVPDQYVPNAEAVAGLLQAIRDQFGPVLVTSCYRQAGENASVGGVSDSQHLTGSAADAITVTAAQQTVASWMIAQVGNGTFPEFSQFIAYADDPHFHIGLPFTDGRANNQLLICYTASDGSKSYAPLSQQNIGDLPATANPLSAVLAPANPDDDGTEGENDDGPWDGIWLAGTAVIGLALYYILRG